MTIEEKIQQINDLLQVQGNVAKLMRAVIMQTVSTLPEEKIEEILTLLQAE